MAVGQNQWCHFGVGAPLILVYFSGDWDVHWGYRFLTHGHVGLSLNSSLPEFPFRTSSFLVASSDFVWPIHVLDQWVASSLNAVLGGIPFRIS